MKSVQRIHFNMDEVTKSTSKPLLFVARRGGGGGLVWEEERSLTGLLG